MHRPGVKLATSRSQVWRPNHYTTEPPSIYIQSTSNCWLCYRHRTLFHQTFASPHLTVLLFKTFILKLLVIILSPPSDYFRTSDSMFLSIDTARFINFYDIDIGPTGCSRKKLHKICHAIDFETFVLELRCLHQNVLQRLLLTDR